jgi:hypothetical protein
MLIMKVFHHEAPLASMSCHNDDRHLILVGDEYGEDGEGRVFCSMCAEFRARLSICASPRYWMTEDKEGE